jgi:hypothetical protein
MKTLMAWSTTTKILLLIMGVGSLLVAVAGIGYAVDQSLPPGTTVTVTLGGSEHLFKFDVTVNGLPESIPCTTFSASGKVPESPGATLDISAPVISGCSSSTGPHVVVSTNSTRGSWKLSDSSGPTMDLVIPRKGLTLGATDLPGCGVLAAPTAPATVSGTYNSKDKDVITHQSIPVTGKGCTASDLSVTASLISSPKPGSLPPW